MAENGPSKKAHQEVYEIVFEIANAKRAEEGLNIFGEVSRRFVGVSLFFLILLSWNYPRETKTAVSDNFPQFSPSPTPSKTKMY